MWRPGLTLLTPVRHACGARGVMVPLLQRCEPSEPCALVAVVPPPIVAPPSALRINSSLLLLAMPTRPSVTPCPAAPTAAPAVVAVPCLEAAVAAAVACCILMPVMVLAADWKLNLFL